MNDHARRRHPLLNGSSGGFEKYQAVEWVGAGNARLNNLEARINLDYIPKIMPRAVFRIQENAISANHFCDVLGGLESGAKRFHWYVGTSGPRYYSHYGVGGSLSGSEITISGNTWYDIDFSQEVYVNDVKRTTKNTVDWSDNTRSFCLFCGGESPTTLNPSYCGSRIAYFKLYDGNKLVRDLVPCRSKKSGRCGFWDRVTRRFFTSVSERNVLSKGEDLI